MNNTRRKMLDASLSKLEGVQSDIMMTAEEEQDYYDNAPENMQQSEKYERASEVSEELESIAQDIEDIIDRLREAQN